MKTLRNDTMTPKSSLTSTVACCSVPIETRFANANIISTQKTTATLCVTITRRFTLPIGHFFGFVVLLIRVCKDQWYIEPANFLNLDLKFNIRKNILRKTTSCKLKTRAFKNKNNFAVIFRLYFKVIERLYFKVIDFEIESKYHRKIVVLFFDSISKSLTLK